MASTSDVISSKSSKLSELILFLAADDSVVDSAEVGNPGVPIQGLTSNYYMMMSGMNIF